MTSLHLAVAEVEPTNSSDGFTYNMVAPNIAATSKPRLFACQKCYKPFCYKKRMETHQTNCKGKTANAKSREDATTSFMPDVEAVHNTVPAEPSPGTSCQIIQQCYLCYLPPYIVTY